MEPGSKVGGMNKMDCKGYVGKWRGGAATVYEVVRAQVGSMKNGGGGGSCTAWSQMYNIDVKRNTW